MDISPVTHKKKDPTIGFSKTKLVDAVAQRQEKGSTTGIYLISCGGANFTASEGEITVAVEAPTFNAIGYAAGTQWLRHRFGLNA